MVRTRWFSMTPRDLFTVGGVLITRRFETLVMPLACKHNSLISVQCLFLTVGSLMVCLYDTFCHIKSLLSYCSNCLWPDSSRWEKGSDKISPLWPQFVHFTWICEEPPRRNSQSETGCVTGVMSIVSCAVGRHSHSGHPRPPADLLLWASGEEKNTHPLVPLFLVVMLA